MRRVRLTVGVIGTFEDDKDRWVRSENGSVVRRDTQYQNASERTITLAQYILEASILIFERLVQRFSVRIHSFQQPIGN